MGLDIAELMIAFEEEFNVDILTSNAWQIETVGDMVDMLSRQLVGAPTTMEEANRSHQEGIRLAKDAVSETLGIDKTAFNEETPLDQLFPLENRSELWESIRKRFPNHIPELEQYFVWRRFRIGAFLILIAGIVGNVFLAKYNPGEPVFLLTTMLILIFWLLLSLFCMSREKTVFGYFCRTVKDLAHCIIPCQIVADRDGNTWTRETIERMVRTIVAEQSRMEPSEVKLSMMFTDLY